MSRPSWVEYYLQIAKDVASRATCDRKKVGAVITDYRNRIVSTGYNGAPKGLPHCDEAGHLLKNIDGKESCIRSLHAESNALDYAGEGARGGFLYVTVTPCYDCAKRIINSGILMVSWAEYYNSRNTEHVLELFRQANISFCGPSK